MTFTKSRNLPSGVGVDLGMALHHRVPHLTFWKGVLAIVLWPYYLGVQFQRAGAVSTSRSGQYQALAICSRGVNYGVGVGAHFCATFGLSSPLLPPKQTSGREYSTRFVTRPFMSALLNQILRFLCPHRFSWPHSGIHGQDYQV